MMRPHCDMIHSIARAITAVLLCMKMNCIDAATVLYSYSSVATVRPLGAILDNTFWVRSDECQPHNIH
jgi:hypothetical protein